MSVWKNISLALGVSGMLFLSACSDYVGKENSHPLFSKGMTCKTNKNYMESVKAFEEFLAVCPKSAKTHKELADIYGDDLGDYNRAIYHYEKYLDLSGKISNEDRQDIRKLIDLNRKKFYEKYQAENGLTPLPVDPATAEKVETLERRIAGQQTILAALTQKYQTLLAEKTRIEEEAKAPKEHRSGTAASSASRTSAASSSASGRNSSAHPASGDSYTVQAGDTLIGIAKRLYGSGSKYTLLLNANKDKIGAKGEKLRVGQVLVVPAIR